jgi:hypothetical protein
MPSLKSVLTMLRKSPGAVSAKAPKGRIARAWDTMKGDNVRRVARNQQEMATRMANRSTVGKTPEQMLDRMNSYHSRMNKYDAALKRERAATIGTNAAVLGAGMYGLSKGLDDGRQAQMQQYGFYNEPKLASAELKLASEQVNDPPNIPTTTMAPAVNRPEDYADYYDWQEWATSDRNYPDRENHPSVVEKTSAEDICDALGVDLDTRIEMYKLAFAAPSSVTSVLGKATGVASKAAKKVPGSRLLGTAILATGAGTGGYAAGRVSEGVRNYVPDYFK